MDIQFQPDPQLYKTTGVAARVGDLMALQQMVWKGRPIDVFDNRGWSPLHEAAYGGFSGCLEFLLRQAEADPNWMTHEKETAVLLAARQGHYQCLRALVNAHADINLATNEGYTPLYEAVKSRSNECIRLLIKKGADVNCKIYTGYTPLHKAAIMGRAQVAGFLLQQGARLDAQCCNGLSPLFMAVQSGNIDTVRSILRHCHSKESECSVVNLPAYDNATPLLIAAQEGYAEIVDLLLDHGADANIQVTDTRAGPLQYAVYGGHEKCVSSLIPVTDLQQFETDYGSMHPLVQALKLPSTAILQCLLDAKLDPMAVRCVDSHQQEELRSLSEGLPERFGKATLLCHVPAGAPLECARYLLNRGLTPNSGQVNGGHELLPLTAAMIHGNFPMFCLLLRYGAKPNMYYSHVQGNVAMLYALHYDLQFGDDDDNEDAADEDGQGENNAPMQTDNHSSFSSTQEGGLSSGGDIGAWLDRRKHSYVLRLFAAGGEVHSLLRNAGDDIDGHWGLAQILQTDLSCRAVNDNMDTEDDRALRRSRSRGAAVLALLLCLSYNVVSLPSTLLGLVSASQASELNGIAGKTNTLAQLCRLHIFRHLCTHTDNLEKGISSLDLPVTVRDYLLFPELVPYSQTLWTLLARKSN